MHGSIVSCPNPGGKSSRNGWVAVPRLDGTVLAVRTVDQGTYYFALDETKSASISTGLLVLRF